MALRLEAQTQGTGKVSLILLACGWLPSCCPHMTLSLCKCRHIVSSGVFSYKDMSPMGSGPTLMALSNLNYSLRAPVSTCSHTERRGKGFNIQILE